VRAWRHSERAWRRLCAPCRRLSAITLPSHPPRAGRRRRTFARRLPRHLLRDDAAGAGCPVRQFQARRIEDAVSTYQRGGTAALATYLNSLDHTWTGATHYLIDAGDRDVVAGKDLSALVDARRGLFGGPPDIDGRFVIVEGGGQYRLLILAPPPFNVWSFVPYYVLILAAVALLCWLIALTIVRPVRQLAGGALVLQLVTHFER
jgi:hypothetical protein